MVERAISDKNLLDLFVEDFIKVLDKHCGYIIVSGYVAISHGRSRGTEDIDVIIERLSEKDYIKLHKDLIKAGFECIQNVGPEKLYKSYLRENTSIRYVKKGTLVPDMKLKLAKNELDDYQLENRVKLPLTGVDTYFSSVEANIAFKEEYLKSDKYLEDARHLRIIYEEKLDQKEIDKIKEMIKELR